MRLGTFARSLLKTCRLPGLFLAWFGIVLATGCRTAPGPPTGYDGPWTPEAILARSVEAYGGPEKVLEFEDLTVACVLTLTTGQIRRQGETVLHLKPPSMIYSSVKLKGGDEKVVASDGQDSGEWINGKPTGRSGADDLKQKIRLTMIHAFFLEDKARTVSLSDVEPVEGAPCAVLLKREDTETWRIWIDLDKFRIRKIELALPSAEAASGLPGRLTVEWAYSTFKTVEGRLVPFTYRTLLNGRLFQEGRVIRFSLDQGLKEEIFQPFSVE